MESIRPDIYEKALSCTDLEKWLFRIRWHGPTKDKRKYHFTPCRRTPVFGIDKPEQDTRIDTGWEKEKGSLVIRQWHVSSYRSIQKARVHQRVI